MNRYLKELNGTVAENKGIFLCVLLFFLIGIVLGTYTVYYMNEIDKKEMANYYTNFLNVIKDKPINYNGIILDSLKNNLIFIIIIGLLGFTIVGTPFILIMDLIKGYILGFTFSILIAILGNKGIAMAFIALVPQNIIFIICIFIASIMSLKYSLIKLKVKLSKGAIQGGFIKSYINSYIIISVMFVLGVIIEGYISPNLIRLVISKIVG